MKANIYFGIIGILMTVLLSSSCTSDELAFDVIESPVLALFDGPITTDDMMTITATFYELDKSGILDQSIGIDSTLISNMTIKIFTDDDVMLDELTTDTNGQIEFTKALSDIGSTSRLEWAGNYNDVPFRVFKNI